MEVANIFENNEKGLIYGLMGNINLSTNNNNYKIITDYKFNGTVKEYLNSPKDVSSLKMVLLNEQVLTKTSLDLSFGDLKKVSLAKALIENKDYIVLNYFEKEQNHQEKEYFKRLWKKLTNEYHKTIIIFTNDISSFWDISSSFLYVDNNQVINTISKKEYFKIMVTINKPEIVKITNLIKAKNIAIEDYQDIKDLLKAIYRLKENESWNI